MEETLSSRAIEQRNRVGEQSSGGFGIVRLTDLLHRSSDARACVAIPRGPLPGKNHPFLRAFDIWHLYPVDSLHSLQSEKRYTCGWSRSTEAQPGTGKRVRTPPAARVAQGEGDDPGLLGPSKARGGETLRAGPSQRHAGHHRHSNAEASEISHLLRIGIVSRKQAGQSLTGRMISTPTMPIKATRRTTKPTKIAITANSN